MKSDSQRFEKERERERGREREREREEYKHDKVIVNQTLVNILFPFFRWDLFLSMKL